jgi:sterol desaturase/sphingolipid hydroxylase (fatty acid hydroxylase superfamily)
MSVLHALICGLVLDFVRRQGLVVAIRRAFRGAVFGKIWLVDSAVLGYLACAACFICLCLPLMIVMWPFPRQIGCGGKNHVFSLENNREVPFLMETLLSIFLLSVPPKIRFFGSCF